MTRFARARGSKASNERIPDEPTPWHVMKAQLEDAQASKQIQTKTKSAKELLQEKDDPYYYDTVGNTNNNWAEFEPATPKAHKKSVPTTPKNNKTPIKLQKGTPIVEEQENTKTPSVENNSSESSKTSKKRKSSISTDINNKSIQESVESTSTVSKTPKKAKTEASLDKSIQQSEQSTANAVDNENSVAKSTESTVSKKKKNRKKKNLTESTTPNSEKPPEISTETQADTKVDRTEVLTTKLSKRQKRNRKNRKPVDTAESSEATQSEPKTSTGAFNTEGNDWGSDVKFGYANTAVSTSNSHQNRPENKLPNPQQPENNFFNGKPVKKRKPPKIRDDKEHKRRKPQPPSSKMIINGLEVEVVMYDGFPVKKDDAERLSELRKQMIMKGIPKNEVNAAMKLERRKAEKVLARIKKNVCFHCRKAGHNLSDCPELGKDQSATGICFKCGSTEHTHFECKVNKNEEYRFAKCFICREQGHVAKQCPDNPKGLYPHGGACKMCGDVTHLKKDCPELAKEREESSMTLSTIEDQNLESLEGESVTKKSRENEEKVKSKIVKF